MGLCGAKMSQLQEQRRIDAWEKSGNDAFDATFQRLRSLEKEVTELPEGSNERLEKQNQYHSEYASAFEKFDKSTDF